MDAPNPENLSLGRGICYFNKKESDGSYLGERDLGECPNLTVNVALEKLDYYSNRSGLRAKVKTAILQITPAGGLTIDEPNAENMALTFMSDVTDVAQAATGYDKNSLSEAIADAGEQGNRYHKLAARNVGCLRIPYTTLAGGTPSAGDDIYVGSSGTKDHQIIAVVVATATTGTIYAVNTDPQDEALANGDTITDGVWSADCDFSALTGTVAAFDATNFLVYDTDTPTTIYTLTDDYRIDSSTGRIYIVEGGAIDTGDANITIRYHTEATTYKTLDIFTENKVEGQFRFVSNNPEGSNKELFIPRYEITPSGDLGFISDDWMHQEFTYEILKDEVNYPNAPYGTVSIFAT